MNKRKYFKRKAYTFKSNIDVTRKSIYIEQPHVVTISSLTALTSFRCWQATSVPYQEVCTDPVTTSCRHSFGSGWNILFFKEKFKSSTENKHSFIRGGWSHEDAREPKQ